MKSRSYQGNGYRPSNDGGSENWGSGRAALIKGRTDRTDEAKRPQKKAPTDDIVGEEKAPVINRHPKWMHDVIVRTAHLNRKRTVPYGQVDKLHT